MFLISYIPHINATAIKRSAVNPTATSTASPNIPAKGTVLRDEDTIEPNQISIFDENFDV